MNDIGFRGKGKDNSNRKFPGERGPRPDRAAIRRTEAVERSDAWRALGPGGQLRALDDRFGKSLGASRQRARLAAKKAA